jgi:hypothetical protein
VVLGGEGNVNVELVADVLANDLILKAGDELTGAEEEVLLFSCTAVESDAVYRACVVDDNVVTILSCSVWGMPPM